MNNLYRIISFEYDSSADILHSCILMDPEHPIFKGHFPGNPVLPGVCTVQIAKELLEKSLAKDLMLTRAGSVKYLGFISPVSTPEVTFNLAVNKIQENYFACNVSVLSGSKIVCSFKGEYRVL